MTRPVGPFTMVERVAFQIYSGVSLTLRSVRRQRMETWHNLPPGVQDHYRDLARAELKFLFERGLISYNPTERTE